MARTLRTSPYRRCLAAALAVLIGLGPLATPAYAAPTPLGDQPTSAAVKAKPNIMLTVDDSSSMLYDFLPDAVIGIDTFFSPKASTANNYCRDIFGKMAYPCGGFDISVDLTSAGGGRYVTPGYAYEQFGLPFPAYEGTIQVQTFSGPTAPVPISNSGPGAGCSDLSNPSTATCSGGIDPGAPPGLERYPNPAGPGPFTPAKSPKAGLPYEYWTLWPAPAHNSELNHLYYNPRLTYDPPVDASGNSYKQMDAGNTMNWTTVPADGVSTVTLATPLTLVDLTKKVTVGMWCNSDWSVGHETDPKYCRTNGTGKSATTSSAATFDGDYSYPWAPADINPGDPTLAPMQPSTALSIALSKVAFDVGLNKYVPQPAWTTAKDAKYFYENDNILWCDATNPLFPAHGTVTEGVCNTGPSTPQDCVGTVHETCQGGNQGQCVNIQHQDCLGVTNQTCDDVTQHQGCGGLPQACVAGPSGVCHGVGHDHCGPPVSQTCVGYISPQPCGNLQPQSCVGGGSPACSITTPSCVPQGGGHWTDVPAGCDGSCGTPECSCTWVANPSLCSTAPYQTCSSASECNAPGSCPDSSSCDASHPCPAGQSTCSNDHQNCNNSNDCKKVGSCFLGTCYEGETCKQDGVCSSGSGTCHADASGPDDAECPPKQFCALATTQECGGGNPPCNDHSGTCDNGASGPCFIDGSSVGCVLPARCSTVDGSYNNAGASCSNPGSGLGGDSSECPLLSGRCSIDNLTCTGSCPDVGGCSSTGFVCHSPGEDLSECPPFGGSCSRGYGTCDVTMTSCPDKPGNCDNDLSRQCTVAGTSQCQLLGATCVTDENPPVNTGIHCSGPSDPVCMTQKGYCSGDSAKLPVCDDTTHCPDIPGSGTCVGAPSIQCTVNGQCPGSVFGPASAVCSDLLNGSISFVNGSFETPLTGKSAEPASWPYNLPPLHEYMPTETNVGWTFNEGGAIVRLTDPTYLPPPGGDGAQVALLQNIVQGNIYNFHYTGSMTQTLNLYPGVYTLSFAAARRSYSCPDASNAPLCGWNQYLLNAVQVTVDGVQQAGLVAPPADGSFMPVSMPVTVTGSGLGPHTFTFTGTNPSNYGDAGTFIDAVSLNGSGAGISLLEDANNTGMVCRHNNKDYGGGASRYNYPDDRYNTPVAGGAGPNACTASPRYATIARHYWKTGVEWCEKAVTSPGNEWLGYGAHTGTCQDSPDTAHFTPRFYQFGAETGCDAVTCPPSGILPSAAYNNNDIDTNGTPAFQRMDLDVTVNPNFQHDFIDDSHTPQQIKRSFDEEMTNYANWFAYYRTRITAVKTVTSLVFKAVDTQYRVGFHTLFLDPKTSTIPSFLNIDDFTSGQAALFYSKLFGITIPLGQQTPTLDAVVRIGEYYRMGTVAELPGSGDPIKLSCEKNWHFLFTDGYTNQPGLPTSIPLVNDQDLTVPSYPGSGAAATAIGGLVVGNAWPRPYQEDPLKTSSNSLADYAMYYWVTDLRSSTTGANDLPDNVPTCPDPRDVTCADPANWQHVNFAAIALGTSGKLPAGSPAATEALLTQTAPPPLLQWPQPQPTVNKPDSSGVDDLWHAAVNARGDFVNAETPEDVKLGLGQLLQASLNSTGTRSGAGFVSNTFGPLAKFLYRAQFTPGWGGSLAKIEFDTMTGLPLAVGPQNWDAAAQLTTQLQVSPGNPTPWFKNRKIVTFNDQSHAKVPFLWANLSPNQQISLAPGKPTRGQAIVEFLRGNRAKEGIKLGQFRKRPIATVLGDIVDSSPVYVGAPSLPYLDPGYSAWANANASRAARVYAGANDGMLHAFDDVTGDETWAYIPSPLYRGDTTGLGGLSYQDGALPPFRHHFYVDSTPRVVDVDFNAPNGDQWHSILVGGLGKGGNRYYALDVTNPVDPTDVSVTEAAVATDNVLWEFPPVGDTTIDMGYSYGRPFIAKTRAFGGEWLVIVASGYNNPTGTGKLYFLRASDGTKEFELSAVDASHGGVCDNGEPAGLAHAAGYVQDYRNQLVEQIYAGDLCGNLWRFDVSDKDESKWQATVGVMARLVDGLGKAQPVTTPPEIKIDPDNGVDRWVFVGTGRLLDDSDLAKPDPPQQQTLYALRDGTDTTPLSLLVPPLDRTTAGMVPIPHGSSVNNFGLSAKPDKGWFDDLPLDKKGEVQRIIVPPQAAAGVIAYIGTSRQDDVCLTGLPATVYARSYATGQSVLENTTASLVESDYSDTAGGVGLSVVSFEQSGGGAATGLDVRVAVTGFNGSVRFYKTAPQGSGNKYRMSWRLLAQ